MNIDVFINNINTEIIAPIIVLLFVLALVLFFWGVFEYIQGAANETTRGIGRSHMMWGIIGIFIMVSAWAIMKIVMNSVGIDIPANPPAGIF